PVDDALRTRIRDAAEGNPLFVEEMLAMVRESGNGGDVVVPPTIQALLAARLDQLDPSERAVLERGAVEGKVFHRGAVEALTPEESQARARLTAAGRRALSRYDLVAAVNLLERSAALMRPEVIDLGLELDRIDAAFFLGEPREAIRLAESLSEQSEAANDRIGELCGRIKQGEVRIYVEPEGAAAALVELVDEALPVFEAAGDDLALYVAYRARAQIAHMRALMDSALEALETAVVHARRRARLYPDIWAGPPGGAARYFGSTPISDLLAWLDEQESRGLHHAANRLHRAGALAMLGRTDEARALITG